MGEITEIGWCDSTYNHWIGCAKISRGCRFCYAELQERRWHPSTDRRRAQVWGRNASRRLTSAANRRKPFSWNRKAHETGIRPRVFSFSLADVFEDHPEVTEWRREFFHMIEETPFLRWMLLTKRIDLVEQMTKELWGTDWPRNVWIGTSVEGQREADARLPILLNLQGPAERFVSAEPLLDEVVVAGQINSGRYPLSLLIVGGESGPKARPMHPAWARTLIDQAEAAGVPAYFKQWGEYTPYQPTVADSGYPGGQRLDWDREPTAWLDRATARVVRAEHEVPRFGDWQGMWRVGKGAAGRRLDGLIYDGVVQSWADEVKELADARR